MSSLLGQIDIGTMQFVMDSNGYLDNIHEHQVCQSFPVGSACVCCTTMWNYYTAGGNINSRDRKTGETFLHILANYIHLYMTPNGVRVVYMLATKVDLNFTDNNGDTALHKMVRVPGAYRCIIALMRCGSSPFIKNKAGRTPEEEILHLKNEGWEENLHWLRKYMPGLWAAVMAPNPDPLLIERLLQFWCRTTRIEDSETVNLKYQVHMSDAQLDIVFILEKYENANEMALAMLSGKAQFIGTWKLAEDMQKVDINTKDYSYQYCYQDYPTSPRPLLAAMWEIDQEPMIKTFMELRPDTSVKYTFESVAANPPKPIFFQLVNPKSRPENEGVTLLILKHSDLNIRNALGQTVLMEAMHHGETERIINGILSNGINIAARDGLGRTARHHADMLKRTDYRDLIDKHMLQLIRNIDIEKLESLVMQMYDALSKRQLSALTQRCSKKVIDLMKNIDAMQAHIRKLFSLVKSGNLSLFVKNMSKKYANARDKAGRSLLHYAIQHCPMISKFDTKSYREERNEDVILVDLSGTEELISSHDEFESTNSPQNNRKGCNGILRLFRNDNSGHQKFHSSLSSNGNSCNVTQDCSCIITYLVQQFPCMLNLSNNFNQTPLHYAFIFSAGNDIVNLLKNSGASDEIKDVFDFVPEDYDCQQCGQQTFNVRRQPTINLDLDIFLTESNFEERFYEAVQSDNLVEVKNMVPPLLELRGESKFSYVLFDCIDRGNLEVAQYLVESGFPTDVSKQYEICDPDKPLCAMMECNHASTSLRQRAVEAGAVDLVRLIDEHKPSVW